MSKLLKTMLDQTPLTTTAPDSAPLYVFARQADGSIECFGLIGEKVEILGFRVEPAEAENILRSHSGVLDCVIVARGDVEGDSRLVAYVVPQPGASLDPAALQSLLRPQLPEYMGPAAFDLMAKISFMPNSAEVDGLRTGGGASNLLPLRRVERVDRSSQLPLSFTQQQFWVLNQLHPHDSGYKVKTAIRSLTRLRYKIMALDCDNTLWNGICGEDGPLGVVIDGPRQALQQFMLKQRERGMLLCLCSKSSEKDVWDVFEQNPGMLLRREDLSGCRINGERKPQNLRAFAQELGFGLDSFVFLGNSPIECAEVEAEIPEMLTLQVPEQVERLPAFLKSVWAFDHFGSTEVDRRRSDFYKDNQQREELRRGQSLDQITYRLHMAGLSKPIHELAGHV